ncbi:hypothetical protein C440_05113 [Haloferax mucosum ATCC BAA-1512]|uniref:DUF8070 domain-containing protein n=2 Tax=Haloferax mucosum TaxID=403181 RepID=M0IID6_9EURY|nr:hypothetical protein C440_05113 [Haloferax mucosum ATCC BAA-1512]
MYMVLLVGTGLLLVAAGGGAVGQMGVSQTEHAGETGGREAAPSTPGLKSTLNTDTSLRVSLLFYGFGIFLWSLIVLTTLRDTLV